MAETGVVNEKNCMQLYEVCIYVKDVVYFTFKGG